jgi:hypothetical protein
MRKFNKESITYELSEFDEQVLLANWLNLKCIRFTASANGELRNIVVAKKLKKLGVSPGFPDIEIPIPKGRFFGLYIEMKRKNKGKLSSFQSEWLKYLNEQGYLALQANGIEHAKDIVTNYMKL